MARTADDFPEAIGPTIPARNGFFQGCFFVFCFAGFLTMIFADGTDMG